MVEIHQKTALYAEKQPVGQVFFQSGEGLPTGDTRLGAVEQTPPAGPLRPHEIAQGEGEVEPVAEDLHPVQSAPPQIRAAAQGHLKG